jgi:hypothetical protein
VIKDQHLRVGEITLALLLTTFKAEYGLAERGRAIAGIPGRLVALG